MFLLYNSYRYNISFISIHIRERQLYCLRTILPKYVLYIRVRSMHIVHYVLHNNMKPIINCNSINITHFLYLQFQYTIRYLYYIGMHVYYLPLIKKQQYIFSYKNCRLSNNSTPIIVCLFFNYTCE